MKNYYHTLGLKTNASLSEIKKAYKKKAFLLHPDRNLTKDTHEEFVKVSEAYQILKEYHLNNKYTTRETVENLAKEAQKRKEEARKKAREYAKMKYQEFINSDEYKELQVFYKLTDLLIVFFIFLVFLVPLLVLKTSIAGIIYLLLYFLSLFLFQKKFPIHKEIDKDELFKYLKKTFPFKRTLPLILALFNTYALFYLGLKTLLPFYLLIFLYSFSFILSHLLFSKKTKINWGFLYIPFLISLSLQINYSYSTEKSQYHLCEIEDTDGTNVSFQKENKFNQLMHTRIFFDKRTELIYASHISYETRRGILGIETIKQRKIIIKKEWEEEYEKNKPSFKF